MTVSMQMRLNSRKQSIASRSRVACILLLTTSSFLISNWSYASDIHGRVHDIGQSNTTACYQQTTTTMQQNVTGFSMGPMTQIHQESFTRQPNTRTEAIQRISNGSQPDLVHPVGEPTSLQKEAVAKEVEIEAIHRKSVGSQPDLVHLVGAPTNLQKEAVAKEAEIEAIHRKNVGSQPDLVHPVDRPTNLQKEAVAKETQALVKAIPRKGGRPQSDDVDGTRFDKWLQPDWAWKLPEKKKALPQQGQGENNSAPQMPASRSNGAVLSGNTKTTGGEISRKNDPIQEDLCDTGKAKQILAQLKRDLATKVNPNKPSWLYDSCDTGRHERLRTILRQFATRAQWNKYQDRPEWCGNERRDRLETLKWKAESAHTFEQPLGWISEAHVSNDALHKLCSGGRCPDADRGSNVAPGISKETQEKLLYPSGSPYSDETKREIEKAAAQGTLIGAGIGVAVLALGLAAKGLAALATAGVGATASNPNSANRALQFFKNTAGKFGNAIKNLIDRTPKYSLKDFPKIANKVGQKQLRHIAGRTEYRGGGFLNSVDDAQKVLDAYRRGSVNILGKTKQGFPVIRYESVTGTNVNLGAGVSNQSTNVFMIKGTTSPSVVPMNPYWRP